MTSVRTPTLLLASAAVAAVLSVVQPLLALGPLTASGPLNGLHAPNAYALLLVSVVAAVAAHRWSRQSGDKGLFFHALSLPVLAVVQIGLGEMELAMVHIALGFAFLLAAVSLFTLALRKRGARAAG